MCSVEHQNDVSAGMTSLLPDFIILCVCASTGVSLITKEHFAAAVALDIPVVCVITKADSASAAVLARTVHTVRLLLASAADAACSRVDYELLGGSADDISDIDSWPRLEPDGSGMFEADADPAADLRREQVCRLSCWLFH